MASRMLRTWLIRAAPIMVILGLLGMAPGCDSSSPSEAPDFVLPTLAAGNISLSELQGTLVVLNFWSVSCSYCRQQLPYLENVAQQAGAQIEVIAVNMVDSASSVQEFFGEYEPTMTVVLDENAEVFVNYCQNFDNSRGYIPFTLFIDSQGLVQYKRIGAFASEEALWDTLHDVFGITIP
jgi:thiol-disulfide isomerase/thioredoxin